MIFSTLILIQFFVSTYSSSSSLSNITLSGCSYTDTCSVSGIEGICVSKSSGCCTGTLSTGYCPGSSDIQCCTNAKCSTPTGSGTCKQTSACTQGTSVSGYCSGPSDLQCCVTDPNPPSGGVYGLDIADLASVSTHQCFMSNGFDTFIIPRGYRSTGAVDSNVCSNLKNAQTAGIKYRDVYMFPCPTCSYDAATQMSQLLTYLNANCKNAWSGRVWLDIEGSQYWLGSNSANKAWYEDLVDSCSKNNIQCGVYSSATQWSEIFGSQSYSYGSELPLWYAHYDQTPSFYDFTPFAGWSTPFIKQYAGDATLCSFDVDKDWAPSWD